MTTRGDHGAVPERIRFLTPFVDAGIFGPYEIWLADTVSRLEPSASTEALLALAAAGRGSRMGSVCLHLHDVPRLLSGPDGPVGGPGVWPVPWPDPIRWADSIERSAIVARPGLKGGGLLRPLVWDGARLYLQRHWNDEQCIEDGLRQRLGSDARTRAPVGTGWARPADDLHVGEVLDAVFGPSGPEGGDEQRLAVERGLTSSVSIIAGGPGTGKTRTVARLLVASHLMATARGTALQVAMAAPTGKAAQRLHDAVQTEIALFSVPGIDTTVPKRLTDSDTDTTTVHRLLGARPDGVRRHDREDPLRHDLIIVDEVSMVPLSLMADLLDAMRPGARLVLVGDPNQLVSVEAGVVLADLVGPMADGDGSSVHPDAPLSGRVTVLRHMHRFGAGSPIARLAESVRRGQADRVIELLGAGQGGITWVSDPRGGGLSGVLSELVDSGTAMVNAARRGDAEAALTAAGAVKVLTATRRGEYGLADWSGRIERAVGIRTGARLSADRWPVGRPLMVTANDRASRVANGDVGVVVDVDGRRVLALAEPGGVRFVAPSRLSSIESWWAMTIHKSQGSELMHAVVSLPAVDSPVLSRQLFYTGVSRSKERLTVVGTEEVIRAAVDRPVARVSGLRRRLWPD
ncbi:MAG: exodeoxyribonuclease V subunit alpha [Acidimicrobiales bacterium]